MTELIDPLEKSLTTKKSMVDVGPPPQEDKKDSLSGGEVRSQLREELHQVTDVGTICRRPSSHITALSTNQNGAGHQDQRVHIFDTTNEDVRKELAKELQQEHFPDQANSSNQQIPPRGLNSLKFFNSTSSHSRYEYSQPPSFHSHYSPSL